MVLAARTINSVFMHSMLVVLLVSPTRFRILLDYILRPDVSFTRNEDVGGRSERKEKTKRKDGSRGSERETTIRADRRARSRARARA